MVSVWAIDYWQNKPGTFFRFENAFSPYMPEKCLLLLDSYSGQKDDDIVPNDNLKRLTIPPRATSEIQPLDVGVFRYCKLFSKRIFNYVILENIEINLKDRNNICKMWSLIFNQFNSVKFTNFFKNSWSCLENNPIKLESPNIYKILFEFNNNNCEFCNFSTFVKCSICEKYLCFKDFFIKYHYH